MNSPEQIIAFLLEDIAYEMKMFPLRPQDAEYERFDKKLRKKRIMVEAVLVQLLQQLPTQQNEE